MKDKLKPAPTVLAALGFLLSLAAYVPLAHSDSQPVKLIFIHHSCGSNWLNDGNGGLDIALRDSGYFVSDTN